MQCHSYINDTESMKSIHILTTLIVAIFAVCSSGQTNAQNKQSDASISGHVIDAKTGEHLPYVTVMVGGTQLGIQTSSSGHYAIRNLPVGKHVIRGEFQPRRGTSLPRRSRSQRHPEPHIQKDGTYSCQCHRQPHIRYNILTYPGGRTHVPAGSPDRERLPELRFHAGKNQRTRRTLFADSHRLQTDFLSACGRLWIGATTSIND